MIYTITFNPSLDDVIFVEDFEIGKTNRSYSEKMFPGGKGFNVSTILHRLGLETTALGFVAGFTGKEIERQLKERGFACDLIDLEEGFSRINIKMKGKQETEINGSGPVIPKEKTAQLMAKIKEMKKDDWLVLAGSIPSSLSNDTYAQMMALVEAKGIRVVVDATGELLLKTLVWHPFLIKPNRDELEEIFGYSIPDAKTLISAARKLQAMGAENVLVSLGSKGAMLVSQDGKIYQCPAANGILKNSVGSGDSMVAGFIAGYMKSGCYDEALRLGSACGGATAFSEDLAQKELIDQVYETLQAEEIRYA